MNEKETEGAAANATAAYTTTLLEVARDALQEGAAAAAVVSNITATQIAEDALLSCLEECKELSIEVDVWNDYVKSNISRGRHLKKKKAQAAAKSFTALEQSLSKVCHLHDIWEVNNTVPEIELEELTQLVIGWEECLSLAKICFYGYSCQENNNAAMLGLKFLTNRSQDDPNNAWLPNDVFQHLQKILETMFNKMAELQVPTNKSKDSATSPVEDDDDAANTPVRGEDIPVVNEESPIPSYSSNKSQDIATTPTKGGNNYVDTSEDNDVNHTPTEG